MCKEERGFQSDAGHESIMTIAAHHSKSCGVVVGRPYKRHLLLRFRNRAIRNARTKNHLVLYEDWMVIVACLQHDALLVLLAAFLVRRQESSAGGVLEDFSDTIVGLG